MDTSVSSIEIGVNNLIRNRFNNDYSLVKTSLVKIIRNVLERFLRLKTVDPTVQKNTEYQETLKKYSYYIELVDFGSTDIFINNYVRPVFLKNEADLLRRQF